MCRLPPDSTETRAGGGGGGGGGDAGGAGGGEGEIMAKSVAHVLPDGTVAIPFSFRPQQCPSPAVVTPHV